MKELAKGASLSVASAKAGMTRQTGAKYRRLGRLPSELKKVRDWRTREDPFASVWTEVEALLQKDEQLQAKTIFDELQERHPDRFEPGQLRTLQRHVRRWKALSGDDARHELFFPQRHRPGEAMQTDFTHTSELSITIAGAVFKPLLCHVVLVYSGWEWAITCRSESIISLRMGIQEAVFRLGKVPTWNQTDNSTGATHRVGEHEGKRPFNQEYVDLMDHFGMQARTTKIGAKEQNGTVEAHNGALKRFLDQQLRLRGSRNFDNEEQFGIWLNTMLERANRRRAKRLQEDLDAMKPLTVARLPNFTEYRGVSVSSHATVNIKENLYSVPPRLRGHRVNVRVHESHIEIFYADEMVLTTTRLVGRSRHAINYRHVIWSLVRKPGAFARYPYRDDLFPTQVFRKAHEALEKTCAGIRADADYLRILHLAASTLQSEVETALTLILDQGQVPYPDAVKELVNPEKPPVPRLAEPIVDLAVFDSLLSKATL